MAHYSSKELGARSKEQGARSKEQGARSVPLTGTSLALTDIIITLFIRSSDTALCVIGQLLAAGDQETRDASTMRAVTPPPPPSRAPKVIVLQRQDFHHLHQVRPGTASINVNTVYIKGYHHIQSE
ncbi:hypothetical protein RRG08_024872 [Elysia crispata]|uniref:Uncharacterized protein n=1 Tax=Elysia crispata TaxID=231223 RepID=A0AAE1D0A2_9GAST|nr:hypothetical protein RRG08_024872 [Elysia crispata]